MTPIFIYTNWIQCCISQFIILLQKPRHRMELHCMAGYNIAPWRELRVTSKTGPFLQVPVTVHRPFLYSVAAQVFYVFLRICRLFLCTGIFLTDLLHTIYTKYTKISYKTVPATNFTTQVLETNSMTKNRGGYNGSEKRIEKTLRLLIG